MHNLEPRCTAYQTASQESAPQKHGKQPHRKVFFGRLFLNGYYLGIDPQPEFRATLHSIPNG